jgi:hypothetical protein
LGLREKPLPRVGTAEIRVNFGRYSPELMAETSLTGSGKVPRMQEDIGRWS